MLRIHSYTIAHYGSAYIGWALRSILPFVDIAHIIYTPHPSHGHGTDQPPPERGPQIYQAAKQFDYDNKIRWYEKREFWQEGQHRDYAVRQCQQTGADIILVCDVDEVWHSHVLVEALKIVEAGNKRNWLINFTHLWRSFNWACRDNGWPVRFIDLRQEGNEIAYIPVELGDIYHFGYAVTDNIMAYKWLIHGHKGELRPDWFEAKWHGWQPGVDDVHPTNEKNWWTPQPFDKLQLPEFMRDHPFWDLEIIR